MKVKMKIKVTEQGLVVPKEFFVGVDEVEIRKEHNLIVVVPVSDDPIFQLGTHPVEDKVEDAAENHDQYLYSS